MNYTVKKLREVIAEIRRCAGNNNARFHLTWADKLTELAERIEADKAKALGACPKHGVDYVGECSGCAMTLPEKDFIHPPAQAAQVDPAAKPHTLADFVHAPDAERAQIGQQVAARMGEMMTEPATQDDCPVCGCVHDGRCLCTRPHVVPVAQDDWRIGFFERWREAAHEKGYAGIAEAITAAPTAILRGTAPMVAQPRAVPDGWVLVPHEPTVEMKEAAEGFNYSYDLDDAWHLMLAAAPHPPAQLAQLVDVEKVREVIAHLRSFRSYTPPTWAHLDDVADQLEAAIKGGA